MPRNALIQMRRGSAVDWTSANPVLASGEIGLETDTNKAKIGDGTTAWTSLGYITEWGAAAFTPTMLQLTKNSTVFTTTGARAAITGFNTDVDDSSDYTVDSANGIITFDTAGTYSITFHAIGQQSDNNRCELAVDMQVRYGFSVFTDVPGAFDRQYAARSNAQDEGSVQFNNFLLAVDPDDDIRFLMYDTGVSMAFGEDDARITIIKMSDTGRT